MDLAGRRFALVFLTVLMLVGLLVLLVMWPPLLLAAWFAVLTRPLHTRLTRALGRRPQAAAGLTVLLLVLLLVPLAAAGVSLTFSAVNLVQRVSRTEGVRTALQGLVSEQPEGGQAAPATAKEQSVRLMDQLRSAMSVQRAVELLQEHGGQVYRAVSVLAGATAKGVLLVVVFLMGAFSFLVYGGAWYRFLVENGPLPASICERVRDVFRESGRGLLLGVGLTALTQGVLGGAAYAVAGIPSAVVLGLLTGIGALIPVVGTALIWVPAAVGLAISGRVGAGVALGLFGALVIGSVDNFLRPVFSRLGAIQIDTFVLFVAILGGLALFGGWGTLLGPLLVRLAKEALVMGREQGLWKSAPG